MHRVASLFLPQMPIERLRRAERPQSPPETRAALLMPVNDDPGVCSVPRGGHWRPGARWAREDPQSKEEIAASTSHMPLHQRPQMRELGRRSEAAQHPFRAAPADEGSRSVLIPSNAQATIGIRPLVLIEPVRQRQVVVAACPGALALGLMPGMAATQARAFVADLDVRPMDRGADAAVLVRIARHALRHWTPTAAPDAIDGVWLDLTGTTHLFGGEYCFCRRVLAFLARLGITGRIAVAGTPGAAHALARHGREQITITEPGGDVQAIAGLPVAALRFTSDALAAATRFGLERIADLLPLPRGPLARRLGLRSVERLDQALGRVGEPITGIVIAEPPSAERRLLEPILTAEPIAQVIGDLVGDLVERLREGALGARRLHLRLQRVDGQDQHIVIGTARATRDAVHLRRLLLLKLDRVDPGLGIEVMALVAAATEPLDAVQVAALLAGESEADDIAPLVDQLAGRVGATALFRTSALESDVPERAVERLPALASPIGWPIYPRPIKLFARPEPLHGVVALLPDHPPRRFGWRGRLHDVVAGDGPERIHGEWWRRDGETNAVRDYYRVEDGTGGRYWLFRRGDGVDPSTGDMSWFMHGVFG